MLSTYATFIGHTCPFYSLLLLIDRLYDCRQMLINDWLAYLPYEVNFDSIGLAM
jgi:hypothetical protein